MKMTVAGLVLTLCCILTLKGFAQEPKSDAAAKDLKTFLPTPKSEPTLKDINVDFERDAKPQIDEINTDYREEAELGAKHFKEEQSLREEIKDKRVSYVRSAASKRKTLWDAQIKMPAKEFDDIWKKAEKENDNERAAMEKQVESKRKELFERQRKEREDLFTVRSARNLKNKSKTPAIP